jgi:putative tryptophan/tyrosine transport system substrate-binding protein
MRRREFITLLGGAAAWPLPLRAQPAGKTHRIGVLRAGRVGPTTAPAWQGFFEELSAQGFTAGGNLVADMRWIDEDARGPSAVIAELIHEPLDLIVVEGPEAWLKAVLALNRTVPIVITYGNYDPIARGYVNSLARPGGHITGVFVRQIEAAEKQVDLLAQAFPGRRLGILWDDHSADQFRAAEHAARSLRIETHSYRFRDPPYDPDEAFSSLVANSTEMLLVQSSPLFSPHAERIAQLSIKHRLPSMFVLRSYVDRGGLMSYSADRGAAIRRTASYVARILNGAKPADLPVEQPIKYELVINLKTAKALGLEVPAPLLARADEVIE